jgi:hypothetical protein
MLHKGGFLTVVRSHILTLTRLFAFESLGNSFDITIIPLNSIGKLTTPLSEKPVYDFIEKESNAEEYTQTNNWPIKRPITYFRKPCELFSHNITPLKDLGGLTGEQE